MGIVTNGYWGPSVEDAEIWLNELKNLSVSDLSLSNDELHRVNEDDMRARNAVKASRRLGVDTSVFVRCEAVYSAYDYPHDAARGHPIPAARFFIAVN